MNPRSAALVFKSWQSLNCSTKCPTFIKLEGLFIVRVQHCKPVQSSLQPHSYFTLVLIVSFRLRLHLSSSLFHSGFLVKMLCAFLILRMHAAYPAYLILLALITIIIFSEE